MSMYMDFSTAYVSTHSRPKAAGDIFKNNKILSRVSTHSRPKAAGTLWDKLPKELIVSTHSRPKAAGFDSCFRFVLIRCFNTQPPEGGWNSIDCIFGTGTCFNTQPPEGGWKLKNPK